jgi:hypothetical protein
MTDEHKAALATGRNEGNAVRNYLEALRNNKPKRGRRRTRESIASRLEAIDAELESADPMSELRLRQERRDLQAEFEQAAGRSLAPFFAQWLDRPGGPAVTITGASAKREAGKFRLTLAVEQAAPAYTLRLPLEIVYAGRREARPIDIGSQRDRVTVDLDALPEGVRLDPDLRVWRLLERAQLPPILRQWISARAPCLAQASPAEDVREVLAQAVPAQKVYGA